MRSDENYFQFGEIKSSDYKVYCSGGGTYSAPARDVELFHVLGRNGDLVVDHGSYQNIEVTYPCWVSRSAPHWVGEFRQQLCSLRGYQRIVDPYHPDEFRLGIFQAAFEPNMMNANNDSAEFDVVFNCKPQRFLTSGEEAISITPSALTQYITNPTVFDAHPLLEVYGYGDILLDGEIVRIENTVLGPVVLYDDVHFPGGVDLSINQNLVNAGDAIIVDHASATISFEIQPAASRIISVAFSDTNNAGIRFNGYSVSGSSQTGLALNCNFSFPQMAFTAGESQPHEEENRFGLTVTFESGGTTYQASSSVAEIFIMRVNPSRLGAYVSFNSPTGSPRIVATGNKDVYSGKVMADSSVSAVGAPTYIDLDIGEAWIMKGGKKISVNKSVYIPDRLPVLKADARTPISFELPVTITALDIIPRWYIL